jgi:hypothetical protein
MLSEARIDKIGWPTGKAIRFAVAISWRTIEELSCSPQPFASTKAFLVGYAEG